MKFSADLQRTHIYEPNLSKPGPNKGPTTAVLKDAYESGQTGSIKNVHRCLLSVADQWDMTFE